MKCRSASTVILMAVLGLSSCAGVAHGGSSAVPAVPVGQNASSAVASSVIQPANAFSNANVPVIDVPVRRACSGPAPARFAACYALLRTDIAPMSAQMAQAMSTAGTGSVYGYHPADLQSAYKLPSTVAGIGKTVAIVDAYDNPRAESDLAMYRSYFKLPTCTTANGCFKKVNEYGVQGTYPSGNTGWGQEIALDIDMVSAVCPNCKILLVEAKSPTQADLGIAEDTAAKLRAVAISNSWGGSESSSEIANQAPFDHPGIAITVSAGDGGYGVEFPAASLYVTAVGGTSLHRASSVRGWTETVWSHTGSGCSKYVTKPSWQHDALCAKRTVGDVAAVADPSTGVAVYDTYGSGGWLVFGGTSVSSPIVASVYALAGNVASTVYGSYPYAHTVGLFDITSGSNGNCGSVYLCTGAVGYDGPTGYGTPNGIAAF